MFFLFFFASLLLTIGKSIFITVESTVESAVNLAIKSAVGPAIESAVQHATFGLLHANTNLINFILLIFLIFFLIKIIKIIPLFDMHRRLSFLLRRLAVSNFRSFVRFVSSGKEVHVREFVVDRSGLTIRREGTRTHLPWRDIVQIGVLQPELGALNHRLPAVQYMRTDVLVVRLRPEVPAPSVVNVLSDEHHLLGYLGLCTGEELVSSRQDMISALERFAGGKLVNSSRQFLDRDPRLRPEMV